MIGSMRTYFSRADSTPVDAVTFALGVLGSRKRAVVEQLRTVGWAARESLEVLNIEIGPASAVSDRGLSAYVNAGTWLVKCECGGIEMVDLELLLTMCCNCWNAVDGHKWRPVLMPDDQDGIEAALLVRPDSNTRHWHTDESVQDLLDENAAHGIAA